MNDYPMGDLTDFSASASKPETLTYSQFEADLNAKLLAAQTQKLQETIKWLKRRMPTHDQEQIMLNQMTYDCIAVVPMDNGWRDRLLQVLQHVLFLRRYREDDDQGQNVVTPGEMRAAMRESGLLPGNRGGPGMGTEADSRDLTFSSVSGPQEGSDATRRSYNSDDETHDTGGWSSASSGRTLSSSGTSFKTSRKRKR